MTSKKNPDVTGQHSTKRDDDNPPAEDVTSDQNMKLHVNIKVTAQKGNEERWCQHSNIDTYKLKEDNNVRNNQE